MYDVVFMGVLGAAGMAFLLTAYLLKFQPRREYLELRGASLGGRQALAAFLEEKYADLIRDGEEPDPRELMTRVLNFNRYVDRKRGLSRRKTAIRIFLVLLAAFFLAFAVAAMIYADNQYFFMLFFIAICIGALLNLRQMYAWRDAELALLEKELGLIELEESLAALLGTND